LHLSPTEIAARYKAVADIERGSPGVWGSIEVVLSDFIIEELRRVLPRLSPRHGLTSTEIDDLLDILSIQAEMLDPHVPDEQLLRDTNGLPVLGTLLAAVQSGNIDYLITGDKDLLVLDDRYPSISPADFWGRHGGL